MGTFQTQDVLNLSSIYNDIFSLYFVSLYMCMPYKTIICYIRIYNMDSRRSFFTIIRHYIIRCDEAQYWRSSEQDGLGLHLHSRMFLLYYENTPIQIYWQFYNAEKGKFSDKTSDIFHISAQNIDCGYWLEPPWRHGSKEYPQCMGFFYFFSKIRKKIMFSPVNPSFTI